MVYDGSTFLLSEHCAALRLKLAPSLCVYVPRLGIINLLPNTYDYSDFVVHSPLIVSISQRLYAAIN